MPPVLPTPMVLLQMLQYVFLIKVSYDTLIPNFQCHDFPLFTMAITVYFSVMKPILRCFPSLHLHT